MKHIFRFAFLLSALVIVVDGQGGRAPESLSSWPYFKEVHPVAGQAGLLEVVLDRDVLDYARPDGADLRLYNGSREIPYVLRVRREVNVQDEIEGREFNRAVKDGAAQVSIDLGESPHEHNEVLVESAGNNFRRLSKIEGSADGNAWATLASQVPLFRFSAEGKTVEKQSIAYPVSRYRFLRVTVERDSQTDQGTPEVSRLRVRRTVRLTGWFTRITGTVSDRESDRFRGRAASIFRIDLGGEVPFERLILTPPETDFARPFELDSVDDPSTPVLLASGELVRREQSKSPQVSIDFSERTARHLKLIVTDDRNEPLHISSATAMSAARQLVFEASAAGQGPLLLYYGNLKAPAPHYDVEARLPSNAVVQLTRLELGNQTSNPRYSPEPAPFTERQPWVVYVVLIAACAVLAWLLLSVARAAKAQEISADPASSN